MTEAKWKLSVMGRNFRLIHIRIVQKPLPPYKLFDYKKIEADPLIQRDYKLCVGCLRCIEVCKNVRGADALGFVIEEGRVVVGSKLPTLRDSGCQFCGYCVEVCPTGALMDKTKGVGDRESYIVCMDNGGLRQILAGIGFS